ncbi:hypothetical protein ACFV1W_30180 [Kitasatospora sp. NPDC059648]|uniref:hypothetical protein n=1 Tax=Kitasatospora sp. NPDC059648 TaxID=3346894 RepID=UPI0036785D77
MSSNGWPNHGRGEHQVPRLDSVSRVSVPVPPPVAPYTVPGGASVPPRPAAAPRPVPTGVPEVVVRTRAELEALRADAEQELAATEETWRMMWLDPRHRGQALSGILNAVRWLLGEREPAPISSEVDDGPLPATRSIGRERIHAEDRVFGRAWPELPEWYAAGVLRALEWSFIQERDRPISAQ